nr:hypothetical protein [Corynebacterium sp. HMSC28B08]
MFKGTEDVEAEIVVQACALPVGIVNEGHNCRCAQSSAFFLDRVDEAATEAFTGCGGGDGQRAEDHRPFCIEV